MKTQIKQYAGALLAGTIVIGGIASAAITPIPTISNTFAVAGQVIKSADINKLAEALNILDARTNGTAPTDPNHLANKEYVDAQIMAMGGAGSPTNKYTDLKSVRAFGTQYTNTTNRTIFVIVGTTGPGYIQPKLDGISFWTPYQSAPGGSSSYSFSVPPGGIYKVFNNSGSGLDQTDATMTLDTWIETRSATE